MADALRKVNPELEEDDYQQKKKDEEKKKNLKKKQKKKIKKMIKKEKKRKKEKKKKKKEKEKLEIVVKMNTRLDNILIKILSLLTPCFWFESSNNTSYI